MKRHILSSLIVATAVLALTAHSSAQRRTAAAKPRAAATASTTALSTVTIQTKPKTTIWINDLRRGTTDESGNLSIQKIKAGRHTLRLRATGFAEKVQPLVVTRNQTFNIALAPTTDAAELAFQQAEVLRESGAANLAQAIELYRKAIAARPRPRFAAAHIGLARALSDAGEHEEALKQVVLARRARPAFAEASAVEGRIYRAQGETDQAIKSFTRAIREGKGTQPEALTGIALLYEAQENHPEAIKHFTRAIAQLDDTEPVLYQLLGAAYEQTEQYKEAVTAYEKYLQLAPDGRLASALRSVIDQLKRQAAGEAVLIP